MPSCSMGCFQLNHGCVHVVALSERRHLIQDEIKALSILHNKMDVFENRHVFQRVADDRNDVRPFTSLEGASFIVDAKQTRALQCRHLMASRLVIPAATRKQIVGYFPTSPSVPTATLRSANALGQRFPNERPLLSKSFPQVPAMQIVDCHRQKRCRR